MIRFMQISKNFGRRKVLKDVSLHCSRGSITGLVGPNSSGKTTLMKVLLGLLIPNSGQVLIEGQSVNQNRELHRIFGYVPQYPSFPAQLTVEELFTLLEQLRQQKAIRKDALVERFGVAPFLKNQLGFLSGGAKQKIGIVSAFMFDVPLLILDEPTASLDLLSAITFRELILTEKKSGKTIFMISHSLNEVEKVCDQIALLSEGVVEHFGSLKDFSKTQTLEDAVASFWMEKQR